MTVSFDQRGEHKYPRILMKERQFPVKRQSPVKVHYNLNSDCILSVCLFTRLIDIAYATAFERFENWDTSPVYRTLNVNQVSSCS